MPRPHAIVTACDANCGDFLADHWLPSLRDNVDLSLIDPVVLDFGLTAVQRARLRGVVVEDARSGGSVNVSRRTAVARFLASREYDQVLVVDGGDLVFQGDVAPLFDANQQVFRGVRERLPIPLTPFLRGADAALRRRLRAALRGRALINGGFLLGPASLHRRLGEALVEHAGRLRNDQPIVNTLIQEWGVVELPIGYNFIPWTSRRRFRVEGGRFVLSTGEPLAVVHNTGLRDPFRIVADFGYGPERNRRIRRVHLGAASVYGWLRSAGGSVPAPSRPEP